jgi:hypothetical protein
MNIENEARVVNITATAFQAGEVISLDNDPWGPIDAMYHFFVGDRKVPFMVVDNLPTVRRLLRSYNESGLDEIKCRMVKEGQFIGEVTFDGGSWKVQHDGVFTKRSYA